MQVIWFRTAQTRSCRCSSCLHSATTVARRTTTTAGRRRLKANDVFTACYSAVFATAAVLDAKYKDDRRRRWDKAIADARAGSNSGKELDLSFTLDTGSSKANKQNLTSSKIDDNTAQSASGEIGRIVNSSAIGYAPLEIVKWKPLLKGKETRLDKRLRVLDSHLRKDALERKLQYAEREDRLYPAFEADNKDSSRSSSLLEGREPRTEVHLRHMEYMVADLVTKLLLGTKRFAFENDSLVVVPAKAPVNHISQEFNDTARRMAWLHISTAGLPTYSIVTSDSKTDRKELNDSVTSIVSAKLFDQGCIDLMVAKLCYNLLVSTSAPNVHTYTTMIVHFTRLQQHHLAQVVIDSFFNQCRFAPNPWTVSAILDHYAITGDAPGFRSIIRRMRGVEGDMRVKRRHISLMGQTKIQSLALNSKVIHRSGSLHWKMPRNELIFQSLIRGSLHLFGVRRAVLYFKAALREGCQLTSDLFIEIAKVCLTERNKRASLALLAALISQWQTHNDLVLECNVMARGFIHQLMHFCGIDRLAELEVHKKLPFDLAGLDFRGWQRKIRIEDVKEKITRSADTLSRLSIIWITSISEKDNSPQHVIENMLDYLRWKSQKTRHSLVLGKYIALTASAARLADLEEQLLAIVYKALSPYSQHLYNTRVRHIPYSISISDKLEIALDLRRTAPPIFTSIQANAVEARSLIAPYIQDISLPMAETLPMPRKSVATLKSPLPAAADGQWVQDESDKPRSSKIVVRHGCFLPPRLNVSSSWPNVASTEICNAQCMMIPETDKSSTLKW